MFVESEDQEEAMTGVPNLLEKIKVLYSGA